MVINFLLFFPSSGKIKTLNLGVVVNVSHTSDFQLNLSQLFSLFQSIFKQEKKVADRAEAKVRNQILNEVLMSREKSSATLTTHTHENFSLPHVPRTFSKSSRNNQFEFYDLPYLK